MKQWYESLFENYARKYDTECLSYRLRYAKKSPTKPKTYDY